MAKFWYPITASYVSTWGMPQALRELISNGLDGEVEQNAKFTYKYDKSRRLLTLINEGARVDIKALYFGATSKYSDERTIGQYGEGLKLAMLVCAREGNKLVIKNQNEQWVPSIAQDKLGHDALCVDINYTPTKNQDFKVEVWGVDEEIWEDAQTQFLRLRPATKKERTTSGECLFDEEHKGRIFVKGVAVTTMPQARHGYNFFCLDIGRDRSIPSAWQMENAMADIWQEIATRSPDFSKQVFDMLADSWAEADGLRYYNKSVSPLCAADFKDRYGEDAIPVMSVTDAEQLKHFGRTGIVVPSAMYAVLRTHFPSVHDVQQEFRNSVEKIVQLEELSPSETQVLTEGLHLLQVTLPDARAQLGKIILAHFKDPNLYGLFKDGELYVAQKTLSSIGRFVISVIHEYSHHYGKDGAKGHVDSIQAACEKVVQYLYEANKGAS